MEPIPCEVISWNHFYAMARRLAHQIDDSSFHPDTIVAIGRGGYLPARILSDYLGLMDLTSFKIEHYIGATRSRHAVVRYPLSADLTDKRVLLVDDVSDSGDTFTTALEHLRSCGTPAEVRTAVLHHKVTSHYTPDYFVQRLVKWRWLIYPWALAEDITSFIRAMHPRPTNADAIAARLADSHGVRIPRRVLLDILALQHSDE